MTVLRITDADIAREKMDQLEAQLSVRLSEFASKDAIDARLVAETIRLMIDHAGSVAYASIGRSS